MNCVKSMYLSKMIRHYIIQKKSGHLVFVYKYHFFSIKWCIINVC
jgi:hypothetical protein